MRIIAALAITFLLAGCGQSGSLSDGSAANSNQDSTSTTDGTAENQGAIEVDEGLLTVEITIAASIFEMGGGATQEIVDNSVAENGFISGQINPDGSVTYTMTKSKRDQLLSDYRTQIIDSIPELIADYPEIKDVSPNRDMTEFDVSVVAAEFNTFTKFVGFGLSLSAAMYQMFDGVTDYSVTINYLDASTGTLIESTTLPTE